jgi:glycosyltransferase involved in cell wall biosynthesis
VAEGLARNLKIFGSRVGGVVEIAGDAPEAELFAENDWVGLTSAISRWIRQGHPRSLKAAALMRERYHPRMVAQQHLDIYQKVLNTCS